MQDSLGNWSPANKKAFGAGNKRIGSGPRRSTGAIWCSPSICRRRPIRATVTGGYCLFWPDTARTKLQCRKRELKRNAAELAW